MAPTFKQMRRFFTLVDEGEITKANLQVYLDDPNRFKVTSFPTTIDNTVGLIQLIETAVGPNHPENTNRDITPERFKLGGGIREVNLELAAFDDENGEEAAKRLVAEGYTLEGIGELAQFVVDNPEEVGKYFCVVALSEASRWTCPDGRVLMPYACVDGVGGEGRVVIDLDNFHDDIYSDGTRILVSRPSK